MSDVTQPQIPPIPSVPLVNAAGYVTTEWWRWFHRVFMLIAQQQGGLDIAVLASSPFLSDPGRPDQAIFGALSQMSPADPPPFVYPPAIAQPQDVVSEDQAAMRALMIRIPA